MRIALRCRTCNQELLVWKRATLTQTDAQEALACTSCQFETCELFCEIYHASGELWLTIDKEVPAPVVEPEIFEVSLPEVLPAVPKTPKRPWWKYLLFWL